MFIKSLLKRDGGSVVDLEGVKYHFAPNINDDHICEVTNPVHIAMLFAVEKDGFEEVIDTQDEVGSIVDRNTLIADYFELASKNPDLRWSEIRLKAEIDKLKSSDEQKTD